MRVDFELIGQPCHPIKSEGFSIEVNHDQQSIIDQPLPHVGIRNLRFRREDIARVRAYLRNSPGITEGAPFNIKVSERGNVQTIPMYLDLMDNLQISDDGVEVAVKMLQSLDWLDAKVDGFTFESMYNETGVTPFTIDGISYSSYQNYLDRKCIYIPYVISSIPNWHDAFLALFSITYVANELRKVIKDIIHWLTPSASAVGPVLHIGQLVAEVIFLAILLLTLIALITQLIACLIQPIKYHGAMLMSDLLKITAVKMGLQAESSIWDVAPWNQVAFLPEKFNPVESGPSSFSLLGFAVGGFGTKGYTSPAYAPSTPHTSQDPNIQHGYFNGTGGDFLRLLRSFCNGKYIIPNQTTKLLLERRDFYPANSPYQYPDLRQDWNGYNTSELNTTMILKFLADLNDRNCIDFKDAGGNPFYPGTILQATHQQVTTVNQAMVCLKGLREIQISAARGASKDQLTFIEKAVKALEPIWTTIVNTGIAAIDIAIGVVNAAITIINAIIAVLNAIIAAVVGVINVVIDIVDAISSLFGGSGPDELDVDNFTIPYIPTIPAIEFLPLSNNFGSNRLNALLLENDMVNVPKIIMVDTDRSEFINGRIAYIHPQNATVVNALNLWNKFYFIDAFVGAQHNRFTKIAPALNSPDEKNSCILSLADFMSLVDNPRFLDNFGEPVIADSIEWFPARNGIANFEFRKAGWLVDPQHPVAVKRAEEIAINLSLKISVPNGQ